jgi:hypothetical protein
MMKLIYCNFVLYIDQGLIRGGVFVCCLVQTSSESHSSFSVIFANACVLVSLVIKQLEREIGCVRLLIK